MATPLSGWKYAASSATYSNNAGTLAGSWTTAGNRWTQNTNFTLNGGTNTSFVASTVNDSTVSWDGITYTTHPSGIVSDNECYLNTYYTSQSRYTQSIIDGVATHEFGHAIGLAHSTSSASVMYPSTFDSSNNLARSNTPGPDDTSAVNGLYPTTSTSGSDISDDSCGKGYITAHPSWAYHYSDHNDLYQHAELVVMGTVSDEHGPIKLGERPFHHYTTCSVRIDEVLQGDSTKEDSLIVIRQMGGEIEGCCVDSAVSTPLKEGLRVILFLKQAEGMYYPINENVGVYVGYGQGKHFLNLATAKTYPLKELRTKG